LNAKRRYAKLGMTIGCAELGRKKKKRLTIMTRDMNALSCKSILFIGEGRKLIIRQTTWISRV
jgi:hypothetical protein